MQTQPRALFLTLALLAGFVHAAGRLAADEPARDVYKQALKSVALVLVNDRPMGTAWVADRLNRLLVTNNHVVDGGTKFEVIFPAYRDSALISELNWYPRNAPRHRARLLDVSAPDDLAVLQLDELPPGTLEIPLAPASASPTERVHSIGNPGASGALWVYTTGTVRAVYQKKWQASNDGKQFFHMNTRVVETQSPTNAGDSGSPVLNDRGELVAVAEGGSRQAALMTTFIDVEPVRKFLNLAWRLLDPRTAVDFNERGVRRFNRGLYDAAVEDYSAAIRLEPNSPRYYTNRGSAFWGKDDHATALADLDRALQLNPNFAPAWYWRGRVHASRRQHREAVADFTKSIQLAPGDPVDYFRRAESLAACGQFEEAIRDYEEAIRLNPEYALAYWGRGFARATLKRYQEAIQDYTRAEQLGRTDARLFDNRGDAFYELGNVDEALKDYFMANKLAPRDPTYLIDIGKALFRKGQYQLAVRACTEALALNPNLPRAYYHRGAALEALGQDNAAQADYEKACRLRPEYEKTISLYDASYLRIHNHTAYGIRVYLVYEAKTTKGDWYWYPHGNVEQPLVTTFAPGESASMYHEGWRIKARRIRIWAEVVQGSGSWQRDRSQDVWLVRTPYRSLTRRVFTYEFKP